MHFSALIGCRSDRNVGCFPARPRFSMDFNGFERMSSTFFFGKNPARNARTHPKDERNGIVIWITEQKKPTEAKQGSNSCRKTTRIPGKHGKTSLESRQTEGSGIFPKFGGNTGIKEPLATPGWQRLAPAWPCRNPAGIREPPSRTPAHSRQFLVHPSRRRSGSRPHKGAQHSLPFPEPHPSGMGSCHP